MTAAALEQAASLMLDFAARTGLVSDRPPRRYLWTDAFAVCNFLALARETGDASYRKLALDLVEQVHRVLGRHRDDDVRRGWLSGLDEREGALHPTRGGLRIGKPLPERPPGAAFDERLEWERDGQYFHYLTQWMRALDRVARVTREARFNQWARELADVAHRRFATGTAGRGRRMFWKMSIDLSRPLVPSMGQHDPLEGLIVCLELRATAAELGGAPDLPSLEDAVADFADMIEGRDFATADPLGLGGLLTNACRIAQRLGASAPGCCELLDALLAAALEGLSRYSRQAELHRPASQRLAFRELGLAIGLEALGRIEREAKLTPSRFPSGVRVRLDSLSHYRALAPAIESYWLDPSRRKDRSWEEHRDINDVMLATCVLPEAV
ncbi:MAG TPA: hypothetical protein VEC18_04945 [Myxococcota bacterium]|nr:hypothetical protein [Myxococcota bacterium]